jgi:hypothetical protein
LGCELLRPRCPALTCATQHGQGCGLSTCTPRHQLDRWSGNGGASEAIIFAPQQFEEMTCLCGLTNPASKTVQPRDLAPTKLGRGMSTGIAFKAVIPPGQLLQVSVFDQTRRRVRLFRLGSLVAQRAFSCFHEICLLACPDLSKSSCQILPPFLYISIVRRCLEGPFACSFMFRRTRVCPATWLSERAYKISN